MKFFDKKTLLTAMICVAMVATSMAQTLFRNVDATITITSGTTVTVAGTVENQAAGTISNSGTIQLTGDWTNDGTAAVGSGIVEFNGSSNQNVTNSSVVTVFGGLKVNNTAGMTLLKNARVDGALDFTLGKITTGARVLTLGPAGSVSGATAGRYVYGNFEKFFTATANIAKDFEVGDASNYTPLNLAFAGTPTAGSITAYTTAGDYNTLVTSLTPSGIKPGKRINRWWTLAVNSGITGYTSYSTALTYINPGDLFGSPNLASLAVRKYNGTFVAPASTSNVTPTVTGNTFTSSTFGDFVAGEREDITIVDPSSTAVCAGFGSSFTVSSPSSPAPTFTWEVDADGAGGGGYAAVSNGGIYSGALTATLTLSNTTGLSNGATFRATATNINGTAVSNPATLTIRANPSVSPPASSVCIGGTTTINGTPSGGTSPYTSTWTFVSAGGTGASISNLSNTSSQTVTFDASGLTAGTAVVNYHVSDNFGCVNNANVNVTVNSNPTAGINAHGDFCAGGTISLTATGGSSYSWSNNVDAFTSSSNPATRSSATSAMSGTYTVTVTSGTCTATANTTVQVDNPVTSLAPSSNSPVCVSGSINLSATAGGSNISWSWSGPSSYTAGPSGTAAASRSGLSEANHEGNYTVTAGNACGSSTASTFVNIHRSVSVSTVEMEIGGNAVTSVCQGQIVDLTAVYNTGGVTAGDITWAWTSNPGGAFGTNSSTQTFTPTANVDFSAQATTACGSNSGFSGTLTFYQTPTTPAAGTDQSICIATTTTLAGNTPAVNQGSGLWTIISGAGGSFLPGNTATSSNPTSQFTGTTNTTYTLRWTISNGACTGSGDNVDIAFHAAPAATAGNGGPYTVGQTINLTSSGGSTYSWSGPLSYTSNAQNPSITNATIGKAGVYTVTVTDGFSCSATANTTVVVSGSIVWTGTTNSDWHTGTNWNTNVVPDDCSDDVLIPAGVSSGNYPEINASAQVGNIQMGNNVRILVNSTLNVCGTWTGGGTSTPSGVDGTGRVVLGGSAQQTLSGYTQFTTLRLNNALGAQLANGAKVELNEALELQHGEFTTNYPSATLTLKSPSTTEIAVIDNFSIGTWDGTVNGQIKAERGYTTPTTANSFSQHFMGSPVNNAALSEFGASGNAGNLIPSPSGCYIDQIAPGSPSGTFMEYDETQVNESTQTCPIGAWTVITTGTAQNAKGYAVARTGAGVLTVTGEPNLNATYEVTGLTNSNWTEVTSYATLPYPSLTVNSGWHLVSNPYPAYILLDNHVSNSAFGNGVQVWATHGPFAGSYQPRVAGSLTPGQNVPIAPFQAFMVRKTNAGGSADYTFYEEDRTRDESVPFYLVANNHNLEITAENFSTGLMDVTTIGFNNDCSKHYDARYDAFKSSGNPDRHTMYTKNADGEEFSINNNLSIEETPNVPLGMRPGINGDFVFRANGISTFDPTTYIYLEDKVTGQWVNLRQQAEYYFTMTNTENADRFVVHFTPPVEMTAVDATCDNNGTIHIEQPGTANWNYAVTNSQSAMIASGVLNQSNAVNVSAPAGVYTVSLSDFSGYMVAKNIQVLGAQNVSSSFTASATTVQVNQDITFHVASQNVSQIIWEFSDGTFITDVTNPVYAFNEPGTYTVTVTVINADGCSSTSSQSITVTGATGVGNIAGEKTIRVWANGNVVTVDLSAIIHPKASIEFYDAIGQLVYKEESVTFAIYKRSFDNLSSGYIVAKIRNNDDATVVRKVFINNQ